MGSDASMKKSLFLSLSIWFSASAIVAQNAPASFADTYAGDAAVPVTLGQSVVSLCGPWKFHVGDNPRWTDPGFDDSLWETVDLAPTPQTTLHGVPIPGFVSGWTSRGHAGYAGYAWYRMRVHISGVAGPLTLLAPRYFDSAFQLFVNGHLAGSFGKFDGTTPELYYENPAMFSLPASEYKPGPDGATVLAFRFYMPPVDLRHLGTGGMHGPPRIGLPGAAGAVYTVEWEQEYRRLSSAVAAALMYFFFALLTGTMFAFNRRDKVLLWPMSACLLSMIYAVLIFSTNAHWLSYVRLQALIDFAVITAWYFWMLTWWAYFGLQRRRWLLNTIVALGIVDLIQTEFFVFTLAAGSTSHRLMVAASICTFTLSVTSFLVTAVIAWLGWKGAGRGKWPLYLALFLFPFPNIVPFMDFLHLRANWQVFGIQLPLSLLCIVAMLFFFSIVLFRQFRASLQRQQAIADDLKQAQEVQQLLIPDQLPQVRGWSIESEYHPAREVGGDFFQIIPHPSDGNILIVAGDIAGKGLQAGMLVAMLVGAIRTESEHTFDPIQILKTLNGRLMGRERGQATCLALLVSEDGKATLANAGHLPPYLNGIEISVEGSLPLGMISEAVFPTFTFDLHPGDRLILISDGIVEAQNERGDLFGFDRIRTLISKQVSAAEIANAAQAFGQQDDISVLAIARMPVTIEVIS